MSKEVHEFHKTGETPVRSYASRVFKESPVGVLSSLAHTTSARRKIFKVSAFILCLTGFLYQSEEFLQVVFQYPTSVQLEVLRPKTFNVPAFTFCNNNGINWTKFCETFPDRCNEMDEESCQEFKDYCANNKTLVPNFKHVNMSIEEIIEFAVHVEDFVKLKWIPEKPTGPHLRMMHFYGIPFICYSLYDRVNNSLLPHQKKLEKFNLGYVSSLIFKVRQDELHLPGNKAGLLFAVHSPFQAVNPLKTGTFLKPGRTYNVLISMEEDILLEKPYTTNCVNYTAMWERNGRTGPRSRDMCYHSCVQEISMKCFKCVIPMILFPTKHYCSLENLRIEKSCDNYSDEMESCDSKCKEDCSQTKYHYTVQEGFESKFNQLGSRLDIENTILLDVYLESDAVIVRKHSPKYMTVEVFSSIGGFIGCWMGINLLDVTDIFESFFRIILYSIKRRK